MQIKLTADGTPKLRLTKTEMRKLTDAKKIISLLAKHAPTFFAEEAAGIDASLKNLIEAIEAEN